MFIMLVIIVSLLFWNSFQLLNPPGFDETGSVSSVGSRGPVNSYNARNAPVSTANILRHVVLKAVSAHFHHAGVSTL